jgi:hypothetical protein
MSDGDALLRELFDRCTCCPYDAGACTECRARGEITRLRAENAGLRILVEHGQSVGSFREGIYLNGRYLSTA